MKRSSVDDVLDAAHQVVLAVGVKRTTFAEVARAAGMSRATLYTHFPDVAATITALLTREMTRVLLAARGAPGEWPHARARLVALAGEVLRTVPGEPLFRKVVDVDAEVLLPYLVERFGEVQRTSLAVVDELVRAGQEDGSVRPGDPSVLAHVVVLTVQSFLLSHRVGEDRLGAGAVVDGVLELLDRGLAP